MSNRPNVGAWQRFYRGAFAYIRNPYREIEVMPVATGWRWIVRTIAPRNGRFTVLAEGLADSESAAKRRSMDVAQRRR
jgi:hypothetical protein